MNGMKYTFVCEMTESNAKFLKKIFSEKKGEKSRKKRRQRRKDQKEN